MQDTTTGTTSNANSMFGKRLMLKYEKDMPCTTSFYLLKNIIYTLKFGLVKF